MYVRARGGAHGKAHFHRRGDVCVCAFAREKRRVTSHRRSSNEACQCGESGS